MNSALDRRLAKAAEKVVRDDTRPMMTPEQRQAHIAELTGKALRAGMRHVIASPDSTVDRLIHINGASENVTAIAFVELTVMICMGSLRLEARHYDERKG